MSETRPPKVLTDGERARFAAYGLVGMSSAVLGYVAVLHLHQATLSSGLSLYQIWIVVASGLGGLAALYLAGDKLGQPGLCGALRGVAGGIWLSFTASLIGGTLSLPLYGTMFGPFILFVTLAGAPILLILWASNLTALHLLMALYHRERETIFQPKTKEQRPRPEIETVPAR